MTKKKLEKKLVKGKKRKNKKNLEIKEHELTATEKVDIALLNILYCVCCKSAIEHL